jgi:O-antigen/teichoic acid export membrane protein
MRNFARNVVTSGISGLISSACQFATQVVLIRLLGLERYGAYVASVAVVSFSELAFLNRAADLSMNSLSHAWFRGRFDEVRTTAATLERQDLRWTALIFVSLAFAALLFSSLLRLNPWILVPLALTIPAQAGYGVSKTLLIISGSIQLQAQFEAGFALTLLMLGTLGAVTFGTPGLVGAVVVTNIAKTLLARKLAQAAIPLQDSMQLEDDIGLNQRTGADSFFSVARSVLAGAAEHTDTLLLNAFLGPHATGIYRLAKSLATLPGRLATPLWSALRPHIAKAWSVGSRAERFRVVAKPAAAMLVAMLFALPLLAFYAERLFVSIYGVDSVGAALPFMLLLSGAWIYQGATAWYRLTMLIEGAKHVSAIIFLGTWLWITVLGFAIGRHSPASMAAVVAGGYVFTSIICWVTSFYSLGLKHHPPL